MTSYTTNKNLTLPDYNSSNWNTPLNNDFTAIDAAFGGVYTLSVTISSTPVTLASTAYLNLTFNLSGTLSNNVTFNFPSGVGGEWIINPAGIVSGLGTYTVTFGVVGGTKSVTISANSIYQIYSDGTNVYQVSALAAGSTNQLQYNKSGLFSASSNLTYDTSKLTVNATLFTTTGTSGNGTTATVTFSGTFVYPVGSQITIYGVTPTGYNGTYTVTASSAGSVSFSSATTGSQTVAGVVASNGTLILTGTPFTALALKDGGDIVLYNSANTGNFVLYCDTDQLANFSGGISTGVIIGSTTAATGNGTTATITFAGNYVFPVGESVVVTGVTPTGYNGIYTVTASSAGSVSFANTTTGSQTVAGRVSVNGSITSNSLIQSTFGGFKFPDNTVQTTAATSTPQASSWTNTSNSINNTYTNSKAYTITVFASLVYTGNNGGFAVYVNGTAIAQGGGNLSYKYGETLSFPVPAGATYSIGGTNVNAVQWAEFS